MLRREAIVVRGVVQGVGFRPFVYRLATEEGLAGFIGNDTGGVTIEIEGPAEKVESFRRRLQDEAPPLSRIDSVVAQSIPPKREKEFRIVVERCARPGEHRHSRGRGDLRRLPARAARSARTAAIAIHFSTAPTAARASPSRAAFPMTARRPPWRNSRCARNARRSTTIRPTGASTRSPMPARFAGRASGWLLRTATEIPSDDPVTAAIDRLMAGEIMAIKGIGGFHLAVDATNEFAVMRLRDRKHRYGKPLAVMARDLEAARELCVLTPEEEELLLTVARPIVLAPKRTGCGIAPSVAPGIPWLGVFLPYAPLQHLLFADHACARTGDDQREPERRADCDRQRRGAGAAREDCRRVPDARPRNSAALRRLGDGVRRWRAAVDPPRARVCAAAPCRCRFEVRRRCSPSAGISRTCSPWRAAGLPTRASISATLRILTGLDFFRESLAHLMHTFEIEPETVVHDLHPGYLSTSWAKEWAAERNLRLIAVQHHHAHIAACMAEHGLEGPVIGLSLDGTGYGTDGRIWGGEVLRRRPIPATSSGSRIWIMFPCPAAKRRFASRGAWRWGRCMQRASISNRRKCSRCSASSSRMRA